MHASAAESLLPFILEDDARESGGAKVGRRILDVGCGSGYLVHVFAHLIPQHPDSKVVGIEHVQPLVEIATANLRKSDDGRRLLGAGTVEVVHGDGRKGYAPAAPYDAIHVGAAAREIHQDLLDQLKAPGRMFIPVEDGAGGERVWGGNQYVWVVDKDVNGKVTRRRDMGVRYVPLTDAPVN